MICHASYPCVWAYVTHMILDTRLPSFLACVEKIGETGDEAKFLVHCMNEAMSFPNPEHLAL